jgi:Protein kinase domain/PASTA domain
MSGKGGVSPAGAPVKASAEVRYRLIRRLDRGRIGTLWEARDVPVDRPVGVRVLPPALSGDHWVIDRLEAHVQENLHRLHHPWIAVVYDVWVSREGVPCLVMERLPSMTLAGRMEAGMPRSEGFRVATKVAEALDAAHRQGTIHGGLTEESVLLGPDGTVRVIDFGIAPIISEAIARRAGEGDGPAAPAVGEPGPAEDVHALAQLAHRMLEPSAVDPASVPAWNSALDRDPARRPTAAVLAAAFQEEASRDGHRGQGQADSAVRRRHATVDPESDRIQQDGASAAADGNRRRRAKAGLPPQLRGKGPIAAVGAVVLVTAVSLVVRMTSTEPEPAARSGAQAATAAPAGAMVPDVRGLSALMARDVLLQANLDLDRVVPTPGPPGVVVETDPPVGEQVGPGTMVTLFIGVEPERLEEEEVPT